MSVYCLYNDDIFELYDHIARNIRQDRWRNVEKYLTQNIFVCMLRLMLLGIVTIMSASYSTFKMPTYQDFYSIFFQVQNIVCFINDHYSLTRNSLRDTSNLQGSAIFVSFIAFYLFYAFVNI